MPPPVLDRRAKDAFSIQNDFNNEQQHGFSAH